jgi:Mg-chelatase subunit ChlD
LTFVHTRTALALVGAASLLASLLLAGTASTIHAQQGDTTSCGVRPLDVELIIDRSGSMDTEKSGGQKRIYWAKQAADQLVDNLDANGGVGNAHYLGLTTFGGVTATTNLALGNSSASTVKAAINGINATGNTPLKLGIAQGASDLTAHKRAEHNGVSVLHVLVMLSDGRPNPDSTQRPSSTNISSYLASADVAYSIAVGEGGSGSNAVDLTLMAALANPSANYKHVVEASDLPDLFASIFSQLACPQIGIDKTADPDTLPAGGGEVTYSYAVTNSVKGAPLANVTVSDDKCSPVAYVSGDTNHDDLLQSDETWTFSCTATLTATTTNVGTASGEYNGSSFTDQDLATVTVAEPTATPTQAPTATPTQAPTATPTSSVAPSQTPAATATPEQTVEAGTGTPAPSLPDTAVGAAGAGNSPIAPIVFGLLLLGSICSLIVGNTGAVRNR